MLKVSQNIIGLRSYISYHMSALKTDLHTQLRAKTNQMVHTINEARFQKQ